MDYAALIIVSGFAASVFYHYIAGVYFNLDFPYTSFLATPAKFTDFFDPYTCF